MSIISLIQCIHSHCQSATSQRLFSAKEPLTIERCCQKWTRKDKPFCGSLPSIQCTHSMHIFSKRATNSRVLLRERATNSRVLLREIDPDKRLCTSPSIQCIHRMAKAQKMAYLCRSIFRKRAL